MALLLTALPVLAETGDSYASIDDLPYVTVSRPDMTGFDVTVTTDENGFYAASPSGKDEFDRVHLDMRNKPLNMVPIMKWINSKNAYQFRNSTEDEGYITREELDRRVVQLMKKLKKDSAIDEKLNSRTLTIECSARDGAFLKATYEVLIGDEGSTSTYTLTRFADGGWKYTMPDGAACYFDAQGMAQTMDAMPAPETLAELKLPDMNLPASTLEIPRNDDDPQVLVIHAEPVWDEAHVMYCNGMGYTRITLSYDEAYQGYAMSDAETIKRYREGLQMGLEAGLFKLSYDLLRYTDENNSKVAYNWDCTMEQYCAYTGAFNQEITSDTLEGTGLPYCDYLDARGNSIYRVIKYPDKMHLLSWDVCGGENNIEKEYPVE